MQHNRFTNACLILIVFLLGVIVVKHDVTPAYAAKKPTYDVISVNEGTISAQVKKATQEGWEPVAVTMYAPTSQGPVGFVIVRK